MCGRAKYEAYDDSHFDIKLSMKAATGAIRIYSTKDVKKYSMKMRPARAKNKSKK